MSVSEQLPVLIVDDEPAALQAVQLVLRSTGVTNLMSIQKSSEVKAFLAANPCELVLLDLNMPDVNGNELLDYVKTTLPELPVIVVTGTNDVSTAVSCMRRGAYDYLVKPLDRDHLVNAVRRAMEIRELRRENHQLSQRVLSNELDHPEAFSHIITGNQSLHGIFKYTEVIACTSQPVLITGETGTGKDLIAQAIHNLSMRKGEFCAVNIAGLDDNMFSDTLFGHKRGAFTGAAEPRSGMIQRADNGTLFLDEIGDLSISSQVKLLRLLQENEYFPLGCDIPKRSSARIVVATSQDLEKQQNAGAFRKDLFYRLRTHHIHLPPLRDRMDDLELLVRYFLAKAAACLNRPTLEPTSDVMHLLENYDFPGNIRELRAIIFDAVSRSPQHRLSVDSFRHAFRSDVIPLKVDRVMETGETVSFPQRLPTLRQVQELLVAEALRRSGDNQTVAANFLGVTRQALNKRLLSKRIPGHELKEAR
jgi:DNA-binding NtrC family response regulator